MPTTLATNLKCGSCLSKLGPVLDASTSVVNWEADLKDPQKTLSLELADDKDLPTVLSLITDTGFEAHVIEDVVAEDQATTSRLATYKPLLIVVAYVIGAATLFDFADGVFVGSDFMTYFMGFFFLGFAFFKLLDITKFADAFATYDVVAHRSRTYAVAYPWIELVLGLMFVTHTALMPANALTAVLMAIGLVGVVSAVRRKQTIQCACLGTAFNLPMSSVTIIENSIMLVMAIAMLARNLST